jgi:4-phytase/acid phosphatase
MPMRRPESLLLALLSLCSGACAEVTRQTAPPHEQLTYVAILTRHGVRSPTWPAERLNQYSTRQWPDFGVPPGFLTPHGTKLMELVGVYDRAYLAQAGLLSASGCDDTGRVFIWADTDQRTIETGRALASGMAPDCQVEVRSLPEGTDDPLFSPIALGIAHADSATAVASVMGRLGSRPAAVVDAYRPAFETMQEVLLGCTPGPNCPPEGTSVAQPLLGLAASVEPGKGDRLVEFAGPLSTASTLAQNFLLEYANAMPAKDLGWGRLTETKLHQMMTLHGAYSDLMRRTPYLARANGSNLLSHMLRSIEQAVAGKAVPGALGAPADRVLVVVGHDTNIANFAGMLGLSWLIEGYQRDDTPPGGALVFEVWRHSVTGAYTVRTSYTAQTLKQMREAQPLTLGSPPANAPVFVPGCSTADQGFACTWSEFRRTLEAAIDPASVKP